MGRFRENLVFLGEFFRTQHTTGAVLPSGRWLAKAMSRYVAAPPDGARTDCADNQPRSQPGGRLILEVGPGTGAVTRRIARVLGPNDRLDMVELNERFVEQLRVQLEVDPALAPIASRTRVLHCPVQDLPPEPRYNAIVSGLPLNNFSAALVADLLAALRRLLKPGGTLSFFQYIAIRHARSIVSNRIERERLRGVGRAMAEVLQGNEIRRDWIWVNVPPAWVHHVRFLRDGS